MTNEHADNPDECRRHGWPPVASLDGPCPYCWAVTARVPGHRHSGTCCAWGLMLADLERRGEQTEVAKLRDLLNSSYTAFQISKAIRSAYTDRHGMPRYRINDQTIRRHRHDNCDCCDPGAQPDPAAERLGLGSGD